MREKTPDDYNWLAVLICDNIPNQKFWTGDDWTSDIDKAKLYHEYRDVVHCIWSEIPGDKVTARITATPKTIYVRLLNGETGI